MPHSFKEKFSISISNSSFMTTYGRNKSYRFEEVYHMWLKQHQHTDKPTILENIEKCFKNQIFPQIDSLSIEAINTHTCQKAVN
ncbi:tyrosine-type recombinase/integrase [Enterococcus innesii]|uniref:hypothetical protein n=1 Tax=Enterococcus innesii TaxID=2839759 RepID=UPI00398B56E6